jgi:hypothetical protein
MSVHTNTSTMLDCVDRYECSRALDGCCERLGGNCPDVSHRKPEDKDGKESNGSWSWLRVMNGTTLNCSQRQQGMPLGVQSFVSSVRVGSW